MMKNRPVQEKGNLIWRDNARFFFGMIKNPFTYFELYEDRIDIQTGIFKRYFYQMPLDKLSEQIHVTQPLYLKPFNRGTLILRVESGYIVKMENIDNYKEVSYIIRQTIQNYKQNMNVNRHEYVNFGNMY